MSQSFKTILFTDWRVTSPYPHQLIHWLTSPTCYCCLVMHLYKCNLLGLLTLVIIEKQAFWHFFNSVSPRLPAQSPLHGPELSCLLWLLFHPSTQSSSAILLHSPPRHSSCAGVRLLSSLSQSILDSILSLLSPTTAHCLPRAEGLMQAARNITHSYLRQV